MTSVPTCACHSVNVDRLDGGIVTKDSEWVLKLRVGMPVVFDGEQVFVQSWGDGWVQFLDAANRPVTPRPLRAVVKAIASPENPPPASMLLHDLDDRLSDHAIDKRDDHRALIRYIDTGIAPWQGENDKPLRDVDPDVIHNERKRIAAIARRIAEHDEIPYETARKRVSRAIKREAAGPTATVDGRYTRERRKNRDADIPSSWRSSCSTACSIRPCTRRRSTSSSASGSSVPLQTSRSRRRSGRSTVSSGECTSGCRI